MQNNSAVSSNAANPYAAPAANLVQDGMEGENTSGMGKGHAIPDGVKGWSWGAFFLNWIWAIGNRTWIGLICLLPYVGFIMALVLGFKGREWAWQNKHWDDLEHFQRVQKRWSFWAGVIFFGSMLLGILAAVVVPMFARH